MTSSINAYGTKGTTLQIAIATVDTPIAQVAEIKPPSAKVMTEKVQPLEADHPEPYSVGTVENSDCTFKVWLDPLNDVHEYVLSITNDPTHDSFGDLHTFTHTWTQIATVDPWIFTGVPVSFEITEEVNALIKGDCTVEVAESTQLPLETS